MESSTWMFIYQFFMKGKVIEDYILQETLGKGQYGSVYKAENIKQRKPYAIKVMNLEKFKSTQKLKEAIKKQMMILQKLNHSNIIKIIQSIRTTNNYYLVYQYCSGGTLADLIKSQVFLEEKKALHYFKQIVAGYSALSAQQILHRDIKPANIFLHNDVLKLGDFGFCKELKENTMTQSILGSPVYMAPEILGGYAYDAHADVWALGITLYQMLFGVCPFQDPSPTQIYRRIKGEKITFPDRIQVSQNTKNLLKKMLAVSYTERLSPSELIRYDLHPTKPILSKLSIKSVQKHERKYDEVIKFGRQNITYLAQTLQMLSFKINDEKYVTITFVLSKVLLALQNMLLTDSEYWKLLQITSDRKQSDQILLSQISELKTFNEIIKQSLIDSELCAEEELESAQINLKYYMQIMNNIKHDEHITNRLINCLLIYRHYSLVLDKKAPDFKDYTERTLSIEEKKQLAKKYTLTGLA